MSTHPGLDGEPIHLDYNASTPIDPAVVAAAQPYLATGVGKPSSVHSDLAHQDAASADVDAVVDLGIGDFIGRS